MSVGVEGIELVIEICVESVDEMIAAGNAGANRVELCSALGEGGITPSFGMVEAAMRHAGHIGVFVMVRPRGGDFVYSDTEFEAMLLDITRFKGLGVPGIVTGFLKSDGTIDEVRMFRAVEVAAPMAVTCHRAFDMTRDPSESLETLIRCGVDRVLTTGQRANAEVGIKTLQAMIAQARKRIIILVCGEVNPARLVSNTTDRTIEYHFGATTTAQSSMRFRNPHILMGKDANDREYQLRILDQPLAESRITALRKAWREIGKTA